MASGSDPRHDTTPRFGLPWRRPRLFGLGIAPQRLALVGVLGLTFAATALACQICIPWPEQTLADRLLDSDAVVLAREDPDRPFHFAAIETLKGEPGPAPIDAFLNSQARRRLAVEPDAAMLLGRDTSGGEWQTLGIASGDYERVVRRILAFADDWRPGETDDPARLREFTRWLGHPDRRLHELAYLEVGRAPYASIRRVSAEVPLDTVRAMLDDPRYLEWRSLAILLLAESAVPSDHARVRQTMRDKQRLSSTLNLDAWATAYLAIIGPAAIDELTSWYFNDANRSRDELRAIVRALSVHGANDPQLRGPIVAAYRTLVDTHPQSAPDVTRDLIAWRAWGLAPSMRALRPRIATADPLGAYAIDLYLRQAGVPRQSATE